MFKPQLKFQKILFLGALILSAVCFFYSLGIMTDLYGLYQTKAMGGVTGSDLFYDMQDYNHYLVIGALGLIVISCLPFIFASNKRRKYYRGNVICTYIQAVAFVAWAVYVIINNINYRSQFVNGVDFVSWKSLADLFAFTYSESTFFFDAGFVMAVLCIACAVAIIYNLNWKNKLVKEEDMILKGEKENA